MLSRVSTGARKARLVSFHSPMPMSHLGQGDKPEFAYEAGSFRRAVFADQYEKEGRAHTAIGVLKEILACSDWSRTGLRRRRRYAITSRRAKADIGDGGKGPKPTGNQMTLPRVQPIASTHCASVIAICGASWPSPPLIRRDIKNDAGIPFKPTSCRSSRGLQMI